MAKNKEVFKSDSLIRVETVDRENADYINWQNYKKCNFFSDEHEEGFVIKFPYNRYATVYSKEELEEGKYKKVKFVVDGKKVYYRPYTKLTFVDGESRCVTFKTYEEAEKYSDDMVKENFSKNFEL